MNVVDPDDAQHEAELAVHIAQLEEALQTRSAIARAQGVLMERYGIDEESAITLLKRLSSDTNIKVREVARKVLDGVTIDQLAGGQDSPLDGGR